MQHDNCKMTILLGQTARVLGWWCRRSLLDGSWCRRCWMALRRSGEA